MAGFKSDAGDPQKRKPKELNKQLADQTPGAQLNANIATPKTPPPVDAQGNHPVRSRGLDRSQKPDKPYEQMSPEDQAKEREPYGRAPEDTRFQNAGQEDAFHTQANPDPEERKMWATKGALEPGPGKNAPKNGEPDPNKFGGTPFGKHEGAGGLKGAAASGGNKFANYMKRHPKGMIWGLASLVGIIVSIVVAILSIPFQLIHMAQILLDHNFAPGNNIEEKASRRVMARLFQEKTTETGGAQKATGHPIADKMANMKMDKFNTMLAKDSLKLDFDASGRLTGISNIQTKEVLKDFSDSSFLQRRTAIGELVSERIAPWNVLKRVSYTKVMRFHARVSFEFFPKEKVKDIRTRMLDLVRQGDTTDILAKSTTDPNANQKNPPDNGSGAAADAIKETESVFAQTKNKVLAIRAGADKFKAAGGKFFGITGMLALVCTVKEMADNAATQGYLDRVDQLMRVGNMLPTMAAQLRTGQSVDIQEFGQLMATFNGDPNAPKDSMDRKGWDQSAAAKRINGDPVESNPKNADGTINTLYNPDFSQASNPDGFMLQKIVDVVDSIFNSIPGAGFVCNAVNSFLGFLLQGIELVVGVFTASASELAAIAVQAAVQFILFAQVIPTVLAAASNLAITGVENSVDAFNNSDAGLQLSAQDYQRSYGGRQISNNEQVALVDEANQEQVQIAQSKGWFYRTLDINNIHSVASNVLMKIPTSSSSAIADLTNMPMKLTANLGTILFGSFHPAYAATPASINPYNFQFYGFTQAEIDKYPDPITNEDYMATPVPGDSAGRSRLSVLGDSSKYSPEDGDDPNAGDLLHCFVNRYRSPSELAADSICSNIGLVTAQHDQPSSATVNGDQIVADIYKNAGLNASVNDDFLRYRMQLMYTHITRGLECASTDEDCFKGTGQATATAAPASTSNIPTGDIQSLAQQILANKNITFWTNLGVNTRDVFVALSKGLPAYTTCPNANGAKPAVNPNILKFLLDAASQTHIMVNALTDKCHAALSNHYSGQAVDLDLTSGPSSILIPTAAKYNGTRNSEINHYHFDFPK